jgi:SAM-dependent methyltransferase
MTSLPPNDRSIRAYFEDRLSTHGTTPRGADWNSAEAQEIRFAQLIKLCPPQETFSILDFGCGYGALADFLERARYTFEYVGFDLLEAMVAQGEKLHAGKPHIQFTHHGDKLPEVDFTVASGIFNIRLEADDSTWTAYILEILQQFNRLSRKGFAFNMLTSYSDPEFKRPDLYYGDPCFYFDACKRHFARNVTLLHDYQLYDFTILVRK